MSYETNTLHLNESEHRFEMEVNGSIAFVEFKKRSNIIYLVHTETPPELEGKGVASALVEKTLRYLEQHNLKLVPQCAFVQSYLQKHPEWNRLAEE